MPKLPFDRLPSDARLWIFAAERPLTSDETSRVLAEADAFIDQWTAHGIPLTAGRELRHQRFVLVGVDERAAGVSGCSVDALVRRMQHLERELGLDLVNNGRHIGELIGAEPIEDPDNIVRLAGQQLGRRVDPASRCRRRSRVERFARHLSHRSPSINSMARANVANRSSRSEPAG